MNSAPFITVGIPVYNSAKTVSRSILSVINQSYDNFELIIIDDGSNDGTIDIIQSFKDDRIVFVHDSENRGISYRLNQQIQMAHGQYFVRMDADDLMFPDRLEKQIKAFEQYPDADVIGSSAVIIDNNDNIYGIRGNQKSSVGAAYPANSFIHPTVMGKTEWFKSHPYREDMCGCEDAELWLRTSMDSVFYCLDTPLLFYREPTKIKLQTYCFRMKQMCRMYLENKELLGWSEISKLIFSCYFKIFIVSFCCLIGQCEWLIRRRNNIVDSNRYQLILECVTRHPSDHSIA